MKRKHKSKPMKPEELKLGFLNLDWDEKINVLCATKESQDLGTYLTLLCWLMETPTKYGGIEIQSIPEKAYWSV